MPAQQKALIVGCHFYYIELFIKMTLIYQLDQNDFLQHQLFLASTTERIKRQRKKSWLIVSGCILLLGFVLYRDNKLLSYYFLALGVLLFIFYPFYQRQHYKKYYAKFIADTYKNRFGHTANMSFNEFVIETSDMTGESKINLSDLENVTETANYFYPKLKSGGHLIIPKAKINEVSRVRTELKHICNRLNIVFIDNLDWKWK